MDGKLTCLDFGLGCWKLNSLLISCPWALVLAVCRNPGMVFKEQCLSQVTVRLCETTQWNGHLRRFWKVGSAYEREVMGRKKRWWMKKVGWTLGKTRKFSGRLLGFRKITFFSLQASCQTFGKSPSLRWYFDDFILVFSSLSLKTDCQGRSPTCRRPAHAQAADAQICLQMLTSLECAWDQLGNYRHTRAQTDASVVTTFISNFSSTFLSFSSILYFGIYSSHLAWQRPL